MLGRQHAGQQQVALHAQRHQDHGPQHTEQDEAGQAGHARQRGIELATAQQQPGEADTQGFRHGIERGPAPIQAPQRNAEQGIEVDRRQYPRPPPQEKGQTQGERQVPQRRATDELARQGQPGPHVQQRQG
ncbi:hypothetical protein D3C84_902600 [compost metagenome]